MEQTAADQATEELDTQINEVENPVEPEPILQETEPQTPIETMTVEKKITPSEKKKKKEVIQQLTTNQSMEKADTSTIYITHPELSDSKSSISKTESTQANDAESTPYESRLPLEKSNPVQYDDLTAALNTANTKAVSNFEIADTTDTSQSTDQSGGGR